LNIIEHPKTLSPVLVTKATSWTSLLYPSVNCPRLPCYPAANKSLRSP
jgi:hypothetical protein